MDNPVVYRSLAKLGELLEAQGKLLQAESLYRDVIVECEEHIGLDAPDTLTSMFHLGNCLFHQVRGWYHEKRSTACRVRSP